VNILELVREATGKLKQFYFVGSSVIGELMERNNYTCSNWIFRIEMWESIFVALSCSIFFV